MSWSHKRQVIRIAFPSESCSADSDVQDQVLTRLQAMFYYEGETKLERYRYSFTPLDTSLEAHGEFDIIVSIPDVKLNKRLVEDKLPKGFIDLARSCAVNSSTRVEELRIDDAYFFSPIVRAIEKLTGVKCLYDVTVRIPKIHGYDHFWLKE